MARPLPARRFPFALPALIVQSSSGFVSSAYIVGVNGEPDDPDSCAYELRAPDGSAVLTGPCAVGSGVIESPTIASDDLEPSEGWRERWVASFGSAEVSAEREAMVVRHDLPCPISVSDVLRQSPQLDPSDARSLSGSLDIEQYVIEAWVSIQLRLIERGNRPWLSVSPYSMRESAMELTHALIYERLSTSNNALVEHATRHRSQYEATWKRARLQYDRPAVGESRADRRAAKRAVVWVG